MKGSSPTPVAVIRPRPLSGTRTRALTPRRSGRPADPAHGRGNRGGDPRRRRSRVRRRDSDRSRVRSWCAQSCSLRATRGFREGAADSRTRAVKKARSNGARRGERLARRTKTGALTFSSPHSDGERQGEGSFPSTSSVRGEGARGIYSRVMDAGRDRGRLSRSERPARWRGRLLSPESPVFFRPDSGLS